MYSQVGSQSAESIKAAIDLHFCNHNNIKNAIDKFMKGVGDLPKNVIPQFKVKNGFNILKLSFQKQHKCKFRKVWKFLKENGKITSKFNYDDMDDWNSPPNEKIYVVVEHIDYVNHFKIIITYRTNLLAFAVDFGLN